MVLYKTKDTCCGCTACMHICPKNAIEMEPDKEGFQYPKVNLEKCIECGLCKKVCDFHINNKNLVTATSVYAAKHKNEEIRKTSTSGGAFTAISDYILSLQGVIYGAAFDEYFTVRHERAETKMERDRFKGSKYVQSELGDVFGLVRADLSTGRKVLFTGTPCQCAGLKNYLQLLKSDITNLCLCDLVCHGTPSPLLWKEHIQSCEVKEKARMVSYSCRAKVKGWHSHIESIQFANGKVEYKSYYSQKQKELFHKLLLLRPSCHVCKYASMERCSDITIADYWGVENVFPEFDDNKGISLVIINSKKGDYIFHHASEHLILKESNITDCLQPQLKFPTAVSPQREAFWDEYFKYGYSYVIKKYTNCGFQNRIKATIKRSIARVLRRMGLLEAAKKTFMVFTR